MKWKHWAFNHFTIELYYNLFPKFLVLFSGAKISKKLASLQAMKSRFLFFLKKYIFLPSQQVSMLQKCKFFFIKVVFCTIKATNFHFAYLVLQWILKVEVGSWSLVAEWCRSRYMLFFCLFRKGIYQIRKWRNSLCIIYYVSGLPTPSGGLWTLGPEPS